MRNPCIIVAVIHLLLWNLSAAQPNADKPLSLKETEQTYSEGIQSFPAQVRSRQRCIKLVSSNVGRATKVFLTQGLCGGLVDPAGSGCCRRLSPLNSRLGPSGFDGLIHT
jgi:hypothetical protein